jgi:hypothetical protein
MICGTKSTAPGDPVPAGGRAPRRGPRIPGGAAIKRRGLRLHALLLARLVAGGVPLVSAATVRASDGFFDRLEQVLTVSSASGNARARLSGTLDLEAYALARPVPGVIDAAGHALFNPRLTVFADAQGGPRWYAFAQMRADRGFDPADRRAEVRLDEYALRYSPGEDGRFHFQAGKFATVVGNWAPRHGSWANPFITAPLPYEHLTGIWDNEALRSSSVLLQWAHVRPGLPPAITAIEKSLRVPIVWGPSYAIGAAASGRLARVHYAFELKHAALSSRPEAWQHTTRAWRHPTVSGRIGYRPNPAWDFGVSTSTGPYLRPFVQRNLPPGRGFGRYRQTVVAHDMAFAWRHVQVWAEVYAARFAIPMVGNADTGAYYVEGRYKLTPRFSAALRWNQQLFDTIPHRGGRTRWGHEVWRIDLAPAFRFTPYVQLKVQYSLQQGDTGERSRAHLGAGQLTVRF